MDANFKNKLTQAGQRKAQGLKCEQLTSKDFNADTSHQEYKMLCDKLHLYLYDDHNGMSQLKTLNSMLDLGLSDAQLSRIEKNLLKLCARSAANRIDKVSPAYAGLAKLQKQLDTLEQCDEYTATTDELSKLQTFAEPVILNMISSDDGDDIFKLKLSEQGKAAAKNRLCVAIKEYKQTQPIYTKVIASQISINTFRRQVELEFAMALAQVESYADFRTLDEKVTSSKQWQRALKKAKQYIDLGYEIDLAQYTIGANKDKLLALREKLASCEADLLIKEAATAERLEAK